MLIHIIRAFIVLLLVYTLWVIANTNLWVITDTYEYLSIISSVNNLFHQTGHLIFGLVQKITVTNNITNVILFAGGPFLQWSVPIAIALHLLLSRYFFSGFATLFWFGYSLYESVPYIADAKLMQRTLTGMEALRGHDWNILFTQMNILDSSEQIASGVYALAIIIFWISTVACAVFFSGYLFIALRNRYFYK